MNCEWDAIGLMRVLCDQFELFPKLRETLPDLLYLIRI
jgi:hypothetical protein